jgi:hypothetical protein
LATSTYSKRKRHKASGFSFKQPAARKRERTDATGEKERVAKGREAEPPFYIKGRYASDLEWRVWLALLDIGYEEDEIMFQVDFFGGKSLPGSMVIDFIVSQPPQHIPISVEGSYWHQGERKTQDEYNEARLFVEQSGWLAPLVVITESELLTHEMAVSTVMSRVGK